jgi:glycosyltransferase involved in cell wall biosynthesis
MSSPFFTIVIPTYNRATLIGKTIASVLSQTYGDFEVIVVDDGSTDPTPEVVKNIADPRVAYVRTANRERAAARNTGTQQAKGAYVTFLDSDDLLYPEHLATAHRHLTAGAFEVYHQAYEVVGERGDFIARIQANEPVLNALLFTRGNVMSCMNVFIRRDIAVINLFDERRSLSGVEDWELWIRLAARYPIHHDREITGALVQHEGRSVNQTDGDRWIERMETFRAMVEQNVSVVEKYGALIPRLRSNVATYVSLHLSESKMEKRRAFRYLMQGIAQSPRALFQRRTGAILRNLLFR